MTIEVVSLSESLKNAFTICKEVRLTGAPPLSEAEGAMALGPFGSWFANIRQTEVLKN
jgi:hypothetical protein